MFEVGQRVRRLEDRGIVGAIVLQIDGDNILIAYDEGGEGWWPRDALELDGP